MDADGLQRGRVYDLASPETLDGLIIGGTIGFEAGQEFFQAYCQRLADLPRVPGEGATFSFALMRHLPLAQVP